jgi:transposase
VEIDALSMESAAHAPTHNAADHPCSVVTAQRVDITLSDGRRILVEGPTALSSVVGLIHGLTA